MEATDKTFSGLAKTGIVVVDFWAPWCGPCKAMAPIFEEAAKANPTMTFLKVNTDDCDKVPTKFNIQALPTFVILKDGIEIARQEGAMQKRSFEKFLKKAVTE